MRVKRPASPASSKSQSPSSGSTTSGLKIQSLPPKTLSPPTLPPSPSLPELQTPLSKLFLHTRPTGVDIQVSIRQEPRGLTFPRSVKLWCAELVGPTLFASSSTSIKSTGKTITSISAISHNIPSIITTDTAASPTSTLTSSSSTVLLRRRNYD